MRSRPPTVGLEMLPIRRDLPTVARRILSGRLVLAAAVVCLVPAIGTAKSTPLRPPRDEAAAIEFFEKKVRPILVANCYTCHSADTNSRGGLRVDDRNGLLTGGGRGPAVLPGKPEESLLIKAVGRSGNLKMPPERRLPEDDIAVLKEWILNGAAWTKVEAVRADRRVVADYQKLRKEHWAWQPLREPNVPALDSAWPRDAIDQFLLARMNAQGLQPTGDA
jgi:hypothetical protein